MGLARRFGLFAVLALLGLASAPGASAGPQTRIIGGDDAIPGEFPYQVLIAYQGQFICGGSIIDATHVATAAHCAVDEPGPLSDFFYPRVSAAENFSVYYGGVDRDAVRPPAVGPGTDLSQVDVDVVSVDNRYQRQQLGDITYDSAIFKLSNSILPSANTAAIPLATDGDLFNAFANSDPADEPWATGWGLTNTSDDGSDSEILQKVQVPLISDPACNEAWGGGIVATAMVCASAANRDACSGDSGGPLAIDTDPGAGRSLKLAGITSFGAADENFDPLCGVPGVPPGVYTEVPEDRTTASLLDPPDVSAPAVAGAPSVAGTRRVGQAVTCVVPPLPAGVIATRYLWYAYPPDLSDFDLFSEAGPNVVLPAATQGMRIGCDVRVENAGGFRYLEDFPPAATLVAPAPTGTNTPPPAADTTRPRARIQRVRCGRRRAGRRRCTVRVRATDVGGVVERVSIRVKGRYRRCTRRADGTRRCRTRRVNRRLRVRKHKGGIYTGRIRLRRGRYAAYARARDSADLLSRLSKRRFRVR